MAFNGRGNGTSGNGKESDEEKIKRLKVEKNDSPDMDSTGTDPGIWNLNLDLFYGLGKSQVYDLDHHWTTGLSLPHPHGQCSSSCCPLGFFVLSKKRGFF